MNQNQEELFQYLFAYRVELQDKYENESDIYMTRNQERIFYTQAVTTNITDQERFLDFVYEKNRKDRKGVKKNII